MGIDPLRICEVYDASSESAGSGYVVGSGLVLTAAHVVSDDGGAPQVRRLGQREWLTVTDVLAAPGLDAALLRIDDPFPGPEAAPVIWGEIDGSDPVFVTGVGFPWVQSKRDHSRDTEQLVGHIAPLSGEKDAVWAITITSREPARRPRGSPWAGMSGAALFTGPFLVGLIVVDPERYKNSLVAVRATSILGKLGAHLGPTAPPLLPVRPHLRLVVGPDLAIEAAAPYRAIPAGFNLRSSPAELLVGDHGIVPFIGRDELDELDRWCEDDARFSLRLLTGRGGAGKTRVAAEACVRRLARGWDAGIVAKAVLQTEIEMQAPTLLVVDDAEAQVPLISALIGRLANGLPGPRTRLLLIARSLGSWFEQLRQDSPMIDGFSAPPIVVDADVLREKARAEHFAVAAKAFGRWLSLESQSPPTWPLADPAFEVPLLVHMNALLSVLGEADPLRTTNLSTRHQILERLLLREKARWSEVEPAAGALSARVKDRAVAVACLVGEASEQEAVELLAAVPDLQDALTERRGDVAAWLHELYPGRGYVNGLTPDLLAAEHLARTLPEVRALLLGVFDRAMSTEQATRVVATLSRAATDEPSLAPMLDDFVGSRLEAYLRRWQELVVADKDKAAESLSSLDWAYLIWHGNAEVARDLRLRLEGGVTDPRQLAFHELSLGAIHRVLGPMPEAIVRLEEARQRFHDLPDERMEAICEDDLGDACRVAGSLEPALDHLQRALKLHRAFRDQAAVAWCFASIALVQCYLGEANKALRAARQGFKTLGEAVVDPDAIHSLAVLHDGAAVAYMLKDDPARARQELEQAKRLYEKEGRPELVGYAINIRGMLSLLERDLGPAREDFVQAEACAREAKYPRLQGLAAYNAAHADLYDGRLEAALERVDRALTTLSVLEAPERIPAADLKEAIECLLRSDKTAFDRAIRACAEHSARTPDIYLPRGVLTHITEPATAKLAPRA